MNQKRIITTAVMFLLVGTALPAFAQKGEGEKGRGGEKRGQTQHQAQSEHSQQSQHQAQPVRTQETHRQAQPQRTQQVQRQQTQRVRQVERHQPQRGQQQQHVAYSGGNSGHHYGRIPDDRYRASFGHDHYFRMMRPQYIEGYNRFQYQGYWFGYNQVWPADWNYDDDVYVDYDGGAYYMYNRRHPGIHITLNLF